MNENIHIHLELADDLISCQREYEELLLDKSVAPIHQGHQDNGLFGTISPGNYHIIGSLWLSDSIRAKAIEFPKSNRQIHLLQIVQSTYWKSLLQFSVFLQIVVTFLETPVCYNGYGQYFPETTGDQIADDQTDDVASGRLFDPTGTPTHLALSLLNILCVILYLGDLCASLSIDAAYKRMLARSWSTFRLVCCVWIFIESLVFIGDTQSPRLYRSIFPFLFIARGTNLKLMMQGLLESAYHSLPIIKGLISVLVFWGFVGYFLFQQVDETLFRFNDPGQGIFTSLHCFTSRPYVLLVLEPLYNINNGSAVFFVTLTLAADLLCINLIIAIGNRHYKKFAMSVLKKRIYDRKHCLLTLFHAFANSDGKFARDDWLAICRELPSRNKISESTAKFIFNLEDPSGSRVVDLRGFFRVCALVSAKLDIDEEILLYQERVIGLAYKESNKTHHSSANASSSISTAAAYAAPSSSNSKSLQSTSILGSGLGSPVNRVSIIEVAGSSMKESLIDPVEGIKEDSTAFTSKHEVSIASIDRSYSSSAVMSPQLTSSTDEVRTLPIAQTNLLPGNRSSRLVRVNSVGSQESRQSSLGLLSRGSNAVDSTTSTVNVNVKVRNRINSNKWEIGSGASSRNSNNSCTSSKDSDIDAMMGGQEYRLSSFFIRMSNSIVNSMVHSSKNNNQQHEQQRFSHNSYNTEIDSQTSSVLSEQTDFRRSGASFCRRVALCIGPSCLLLVRLLIDFIQMLETICARVLDVNIVLHYTDPMKWMLHQLAWNNDPATNQDTNIATISVVSIVHSILHMLLLLQLCFITQQGPVLLSYYNLGIALELFFWALMAIGLLGLGPRQYLSTFENRVDASLNILSLILMIIWRHTPGFVFTASTVRFPPSEAFVFLLIVQSLRLFNLFFLFNDIRIFQDILPVLCRAIYLFFSVVFFFAIFAHYFFCGILDPVVAAADLQQADDDSGGWLKVSNALNFNSNLQSVFTLFEMGILGNWSIVMDALVQQNILPPVNVYFFFYFYRLLVTLCVLPLLISFVMQAFLSSFNPTNNNQSTAPAQLGIPAAAAAVASGSRASDNHPVMQRDNAFQERFSTMHRGTQEQEMVGLESFDDVSLHSQQQQQRQSQSQSESADNTSIGYSNRPTMTSNMTSSTVDGARSERAHDRDLAATGWPLSPLFTVEMGRKSMGSTAAASHHAESSLASYGLQGAAVDNHHVHSNSSGTMKIVGTKQTKVSSNVSLWNVEKAAAGGTGGRSKQEVLVRGNQIQMTSTELPRSLEMTEPQGAVASLELKLQVAEAALAREREESRKLRIELAQFT